MNSPHVFLAFTQGKRRINRTFSDIRKRTVNPGFIWYSPFSNSLGKRLEIVAFARSGKLPKNIQENKLFIVIFLVLDNMR